GATARAASVPYSSSERLIKTVLKFASQSYYEASIRRNLTQVPRRNVCSHLPLMAIPKQSRQVSPCGYTLRPILTGTSTIPMRLQLPFNPYPAHGRPLRFPRTSQLLSPPDIRAMCRKFSIILHPLHQPWPG